MVFPEIRSVHRIWSQTWEVQCRHLYWKWFLNLDAGGFLDSGWYLCAACGTWWTQNHLQQATQHLSAQWENSGSIFFVVQSLRSQQHLLIYSIAGSKWLKIRNSCDVNETILTLAGMNLDLFCHLRPVWSQVTHLAFLSLSFFCVKWYQWSTSSVNCDD